MKKGTLNSREIARLGRMYEELDTMQAQAPQDAKTWSREEEGAMNELLKARNAIGVLLRWQSFKTWSEIRKQEVRP